MAAATVPVSPERQRLVFGAPIPTPDPRGDDAPSTPSRRSGAQEPTLTVAPFTLTVLRGGTVVEQAAVSLPLTRRAGLPVADEVVAAAFRANGVPVASGLIGSLLPPAGEMSRDRAGWLIDGTEVWVTRDG